MEWTDLISSRKIPMNRIYLLSTCDDLQQYRKAVFDVLSKIKHNNPDGLSDACLCSMLENS